MTRRRDSRSVERFHLERFIKNYTDFPAGTTVFDDKPDLLVHTAEGLIGIEHTQLFQIPDRPTQLPLQSGEALQDRIVACAYEAYQGRGGRLAYVLVRFDHRVPLRKKDVPVYASRLAEAMRIAEVQLGSDVPADVPFDIENWAYNRRIPEGLPAGIEAIYFHYVSKPGFELWSVGRGDAVPSLTKERIQKEIAKKERKLNNYRTRCRRVWLLMVADGSTPATIFDLSTSLETALFRSRFDRVFLMESFSASIIELATDDSLAGTS